MEKTVQYFSDEYLEWCRTLTSMQILEFLEDFKVLHCCNGSKQKRSKLISMKVPEELLSVFKVEAKRLGTPYQALIKRLMEEYLAKRTDH
jgi:predicted DNA binding CopG/RHH family protein